MALAELSRRRFRGFIGRSPHFEAPTITAGVDLPACPDSEGDILTGADVPSVQALPEPLTVRIVGSRNPLTGEIASYHQEVHGQTYTVMPLTQNQEAIIQ